MSNVSRAWTTANELAYISRIGMESEGTQKIPQSELLKNYFHAMQQRRRWEGLQRDVVLKAIYNEMMAALDAERAV